jgi:hypothetical protein
MTWPQPSDSDGARRTYLVERYVSPVAAVDLAASSARVLRLCTGADSRVRYLYSAYLPTEDTCFCLFQAASSDAVRSVNEQAHFALDRIVDAVLLAGVAIDDRQGRSS